MFVCNTCLCSGDFPCHYLFDCKAVLVHAFVRGRTASCVLQEMYYRHMHTVWNPQRTTHITFEHRKESWENYCSLFDILQTQTTTMKLPNVWLWDMIDDFLYQFGTYTLLKGHVSERSASELDFLAKNPAVWEPCKVCLLIQLSCCGSHAPQKCPRARCIS